MVLVFDGLYNCIQVFTHYFEVLEEESLRDNFVVVVSKDKVFHVLENGDTNENFCWRPDFFFPLSF